MKLEKAKEARPKPLDGFQQRKLSHGHEVVRALSLWRRVDGDMAVQTGN